MNSQIQVLSHLRSALQELQSGSYAPPDCLPTYWQAAILPEGALQSDPFDVTPVNMPPELYEVLENSTTAGEGKTGRAEW
jgi:hypothetical protein